MALVEDRPKPRLWVYFAFWLGFVVPTFYFFLVIAQYSSTEQMDIGIVGLLNMDVAVVVILGWLYIGRFLYSYRLVAAPMRALAYGFGVALFLFEGAVHILHAVFACMLLSYAGGACTISWLFGSRIVRYVVFAALAAFIIFGIVWIFERSATLRKLARTAGAYGAYWGIVALCGWIFLLLISPEVATF